MVATTVGVLRETVPGERRVALVPDLVPAVGRLGLKVLVEAGAGARARHHDVAYTAAGAELTGRAELLLHADVLLGIHPPTGDSSRRLRRGQVLVTMVRPTRIAFLVRQWADLGVTSIGLDLAPARLPAAYPMDAAASQGRIAGYRAVLLAAARLGSCLPPWGTSDGLFAPVRVLVVGAGHPGLQAIDTAHRLGALVHVVELRGPERAQAVALGAELLDLPGLHPVDDDLALREALEHRRSVLRSGVAAAAVRHDLVLTALDLPDHEPPTVLDRDTVATMRPGSVLVDLAAGPGGGNIEGIGPDTTTLVGDGVTVIGAGDLAAGVPTTASLAYAHNVLALLAHLTHGGPLTVDPTDPVLDAMVVTHRGTVRHGPTARLLAEATAAAGLP
ncbi:NAD(P) transhydrogenase subunit alpha [Kitasatospora paracochleata]|uniref:proton-translocating NAD(P)(+) transhydrogenase n=1 Tax=Kitasatospora paracochleata TaxID=58354 RepID=A0ABT1J7I3_9ACTN|nr:NAD(P) transhydrogenase subunit alpha [Kitasatospora paracochleata]MCP2313402.1 NAD(P) transhydrogenase subunit alpha [Kitasatospora paracochleata]